MRQSKIRKNEVILTAAEFQQTAQKIESLVRTREALVVTIADLKKKKYVGNEYRTYETAVKAVEEKYVGKAEWGCVLTGSIIDLRASFTMGQGVKITTAEDTTERKAKAELEFANDFFEYNKLDKEMPVELAKEAEIEGKIALKLALEDAKDFKNSKYEKMVSVRFISWIDTGYKITTPTGDYMNYKSLSWQPKSDSKEEVLDPKEFVYNKFGGRITKPNQAQPKVMKCLTQIDDVSKALRDWREINHIFAMPIFDIECEDWESVDDASTAMDEYRMNIKKAFIHAKSKLSVIGPDMAGIDSLSQEIVDKIKIISGTTGIPVHFLGLLDLLKNRSTGESTRELVNAGTEKERVIWIGTFKELLEKAFAMIAEENQLTKLDVNKLDVEIPVVTQEQWDHIEKVLLPLYLASALSLEYLLSQVPNVDASKEMKRLDKSTKDQAEKDQLTAERDAARDELALANASAQTPEIDDAEGAQMQ